MKTCHPCLVAFGPRGHSPPTSGHLLVGVTRQANVVISESTQETLQLLASRTGVDVLDVLQDEQDTGGEETIASDIDPLVGGGTLDGNVTPVHDTLLTRVEDHLEDTLNDDSVVDAVDTVHGGLAAGGKVNQAAHGSVLDSKTGLMVHPC
jgi:hypothetical protein